MWRNIFILVISVVIIGGCLNYVIKKIRRRKIIRQHICVACKNIYMNDKKGCPYCRTNVSLIHRMKKYFQMI